MAQSRVTLRDPLTLVDDCLHPETARRDATHAGTPEGCRDSVCTACGHRWRENDFAPPDVGAVEVLYRDSGDGQVVTRVLVDGREVPRVRGVTVHDAAGDPTVVVLEVLPTSLTRRIDPETTDAG